MKSDEATVPALPRLIPGAPNAVFAPAEGTDRWYVGFSYGCEPLAPDEAAALHARGCLFPGTVPYFLRLADGALFSPFPQQTGVYYTRPVWDRDAFGILAADFCHARLLLYRCPPGEEPALLADLPLGPAETLRNLRLYASPWMIACGEENFQILWPQRQRFSLLLGETVLYREGELLFSRLPAESRHGPARIVTRSCLSGEILSCVPGSLCRMPNGELWRF